MKHKTINSTGRGSAAQQIAEIKSELEASRALLSVSVGLLSTMPMFSGMHPEDILQFVKDVAIKGMK